MVVRGTSVIDIGGVAGTSDAYEEKGGQELNHTGKMKGGENNNVLSTTSLSLTFDL